ncbi:hypothetical protein SALBM135S_03578 [Streptomyces alboniger]
MERAPSAPDPRRQRITLTARGRDAADLLDERAREAVGALVAEVPAVERARLAAAMRTVRDILEGTGRQRASVRLREPRAGDLGWIVQRNAALYAAEFGWNTDYEGLVARIVADFAQDHNPHLERVWIADLGGRPVGSVMCVRDKAPGTARLRLCSSSPTPAAWGSGTGW